MAQEVLRYVQTVEEAKQHAQELVKREVGSLDPQRLRDDPEGYLSDIIALVLAALSDTLDEVAVDVEDGLVGLGLNTNQAINLDRIVADTKNEIESAMTTAGDEWLAGASRQVADMNDAEQLIALRDGSVFLKSLASTLDGLLSDEAENAINRIVVAVSDAVVQHLSDSGESFRWIAVQDQRQCQGPFDEACAPRHGMVKPLADWQEIGLPKAANLVCSVYNPGMFPCRCVLASSSYVVGDQPVSAGEVIAKARKRGR